MDTSQEHEVKKSDVVDKAAAAEVQGNSMHVKVYAPFKTYFDDTATSISAVNATGAFDILPKHHNFMTLLSPCEIVVRTDHGEERVTISRGIMHVKQDKVIVFLDV